MARFLMVWNEVKNYGYSSKFVVGKYTLPRSSYAFSCPFVTVVLGGGVEGRLWEFLVDGKQQFFGGVVREANVERDT